jgi:hypothetical protein
LAEGLMIRGANNSNVDDYLKVVRGDELSMYDANAAALPDRLPEGIMMRVNRSGYLGNYHRYTVPTAGYQSGNLPTHDLCILRLCDLRLRLCLRRRRRRRLLAQDPARVPGLSGKIYLPTKNG